MNDLPKCDESTCPGHLGKFSDCVAEAVYEWSMDGVADEVTGSIDFQGHYSLYIVERPEDVVIGLGTPDARDMVVPAGNYLLHVATSGAVSLWNYSTEEAARNEFKAADEAYTAWEDEDD